MYQFMFWHSWWLFISVSTEQVAILTPHIFRGVKVRKTVSEAAHSNHRPVEICVDYMHYTCVVIGREFYILK